MENMLGREVVLQAEEIISRPVFPSIGTGGLGFYERVSVLEACRVGEPKAAANDWSRKIETRIPVSQMEAVLSVDAGRGISRAEPPTVIAIRSLKTQNVCAGVGIGGADTAGLNFGGARGVDIEARGELAIHGIADFETVEQVLRFA